MNSDYFITEEERKKLKSLQNEYDNLISQLKIKGQYDEEKFKVLIWRNMVRALPLFKLNDASISIDEVTLMGNQRVVNRIFGLLNLALYEAISDNKKREKWNVGIVRRWDDIVGSKFKDFVTIFSHFCQREQPQIPFVIVLVEKILGKEKAEKLDRVIKYELGISEEEEGFGKEDIGEQPFDSWIENSKNNGFGCLADYVKEYFDNNFSLNNLDADALRKRVIICHNRLHLIETPFADKVAIIKLSEELNFTTEEISRFITFCEEKRWILDKILSEMKIFKERYENISVYIKRRDVDIVFEMSSIFKILFSDFEKPCLQYDGGNSYKLLISPKELLCSDRRYKPKTNEIVHFSSIDKLENILKENSFRLYNTNNSDDEKEVSYWLDRFDIDSYKIKKEVYVGSFCNSDILNDVEKAAPLWRKYGANGKGAVIKFKIIKDVNAATFEQNNNAEITGFSLCKVSYNPIEEDKLEKFKSELLEFYQNSSLSVDALDCIIPFAFVTKQPGFKVENEIRLLKINYQSFCTIPHTEMVACDKHDDECNCKVKYYKVPLFKKEDGKVELIITEIQFGPNLSDYEYEQQKNEIENIFREAKINGDYPIPVFSRSTISETSYNEAIERHKQKSQIKETATLH